MTWLSAAYPHLVNGYQQLYARKYAPSTYRNDVRSVFNDLRTKYGLNTRERADEDRMVEPVKLAEQQMLRWRD